MKTRLLIIFSILLVSFLLLPVSTVFAHLMLIEPVEGGKVRVAFDDGSAARHAEVVVFNKEGEEIARGDVDRDGYFSYPAEDATILVAEDNFGHRAEYVVGEDAHQALPRVPTVSAVLAGFLLIAGIFHYRVRNKEESA